MQSLEYLFGLEFHGHKFGLENIIAITGALGRPQAAYPTVSVAGTNGKGSVCAMVARASDCRRASNRPLYVPASGLAQ